MVLVFAFQALTALLSDDSKFGFIVIDGSGALFGTLQGNTREVLHKFTVDLPKKHGNIGGHDPVSLLPNWDEGGNFRYRVMLHLLVLSFSSRQLSENE